MQGMRPRLACEGSSEPSKAKRSNADGEPIRVAGDAGPFVADWDGDGLPDLLVGAGDGSVSWFRNIGTRKEPKLAAAKVLVPAVDESKWSNPPSEPRHGFRSKICVADWNGDGRPDLLVGDIAEQKAKLPNFTPEQKAEQEKLRKQLTEIEGRYAPVVQKLLGGEKPLSKKEREPLEKELRELNTQMQELREKLPQETEYHGWVWLFLRKPASR